MSYNIFPNIVLIVTVTGVILIVLRHLPEASSLKSASDQALGPEQRLLEKGMPALYASKAKTLLLFWGKRSWHFVLEAKGIKHQAQVGYRIKQIFKKKPQAAAGNQALNSASLPTPVVVKDEAYFLSAIKNNPKDLENYSGLAQVYTEAKNFGEAKDLYEYLVKHNAGNADFHARLGYAHYLLENYKDAVESYQKSLALDSAHPNRYYNLGLAQRALDMPEAAQESYNKALHLDPTNRKYKEALEELKI